MENKAASHTYAAAGVNIDVAAKAKELIGRQAKTTHRPEVLSGVGFFGGLFEFKGYEQPVLISSVDGVGTKLKIAVALGKHDTVGIDLVNHCVNDILTCGAEPLFFLDYIAMGKLVSEQVAAIAQGLAKACREVGCALIGGETAEMPGLYSGQDYDLVGFIVGVVEKDRITMGRNIKAGDAVIGLPSSGLHTNGYSLVRKIFDVDDFKKRFPGLGRTLGEALLEPHRCYYNQLKPLLSLVKGMAHITGGGLVDNIPRVLPDGLSVHLNKKSWTVLPVFKLIQDRGNVDPDEMFRVFNMGIGMVLICTPDNADPLVRKLSGAKLIGEVTRQAGKARVVIS